MITRRALGGGLLALAPSLAAAQIIETIPPGERLPETPTPVPLGPEAFPDISVMTAADRVQRLLVPVQINDQGPFAFTVDTGANRSVIAEDVAAKLKLPAGKIVSVQSASGVSRRASVVVDRLALGEGVQRKVTIPLLPRKGVFADGMLGVDWLRGHRLIIDFRGARLEVVNSDAGRLSATAIAVQGKLQSGQLTIIDADVSGVPILAVIDSGADISLGNAALRAVCASVSKTFEKEMTPSTLTDATGKLIPTDIGFLPFLRVGGLNIGNMATAFTNAPIFKVWNLENKPTVMLGMNALRNFASVALDYGNAKAHFELA